MKITKSTFLEQNNGKDMGFKSNPVVRTLSGHHKYLLLRKQKRVSLKLKKYLKGSHFARPGLLLKGKNSLPRYHCQKLSVISVLLMKKSGKWRDSL